MKRGQIILLLTLLVLLPLISAEITEIRVQTVEGYEVQVTAHKANSATFTVIDKFIGDADEKGRATANLDINTEYDLIIFIKKDNEKVNQGFDNPTKLQNNLPGEGLYIELIPDWFTPDEWESEELLLNETDVIESNGTETIEEPEKETLIEDSESNESILTGLAIFGEGKTRTWTYYGIGILVIAILIFLFIKFKKGKNKGEIKVKKLSELKEAQEDQKEDLKEAEEELKEAQTKINKIKNSDEISEAKKKLIEDEKELMRLRSGE